MDGNDVIKAIGEAVFEQLLALRKQKTLVMTIDERKYSDNTPGWLESAHILRDFFLPSPSWSQDMSLVALIQTAYSDIRKALLVIPADDIPYRQELISLQDGFAGYLLRNDLPLPEEPKDA